MGDCEDWLGSDGWGLSGNSHVSLSLPQPSPFPLLGHCCSGSGRLPRPRTWSKEPRGVISALRVAFALPHSLTVGLAGRRWTGVGGPREVCRVTCACV